MYEEYNLKRVHKVNYIILVGTCLFFMISSILSDGDFIDVILAGITALIGTVVYFLSLNDYVKGFIFSSMPAFATLFGIAADGFAVTNNLILFWCIICIALYFEERLVVIFGIYINLILIVSTLIDFEGVYAPGGGLPRMLATFIAFNGAFVVLYFLTSWGKALVRVNIEKKIQVEEVNEELMTLNEELEESFSEVNERENHIARLLYTDRLTGLGTRFALSEFFDTTIKGSEDSYALILLNIDNFKTVNDAFGHDFGDKVLTQIGQGLQAMESPGTRIYRYGADEFIIVTNDTVSIEAFTADLHQSFKGMMTIDGNRFFLTISLGIAKYPDHGHTQEALRRCADLAMNESKTAGKDATTLYHPSLDKDFQDKIHFQNVMRQALKKEAFHLMYQPLVSAKDRKVYGYEALIRWNSAEYGPVSPYRLITEAEEMGLIVNIGEWVLKEAVNFIKHCNTHSEEPRYISVNISAVQLMYNGFVDSLKAIVEASGVGPEQICLEMTETTLIENIDIGSRIINELSNCGFKIALDDFGTGYSSLSYLRNLPINILKIDKAFIDSINSSDYDRYIVEAAIKIANVRDITVVAEGVEEARQVDALEELGCHVIQGFYFSRPLDSDGAVAYRAVL